MKSKSIIPLAFTFLALLSTQLLMAQTEVPPIKKEKYQMNKEIEDALGYTQAVKVGKTLYISGIPSGGDIPTQINNVYSALEKVLEEHGMGYENVVKENLYTTNMAALRQYLEVRKAFYKGDYPAASWVEVKGLYDPSLGLEVELIAILP